MVLRKTFLDVRPSSSTTCTRRVRSEEPGQKEEIRSLSFSRYVDTFHFSRHGDLQHMSVNDCGGLITSGWRPSLADLISEPGSCKQETCASSPSIFATSTPRSPEFGTPTTSASGGLQDTCTSPSSTLSTPTPRPSELSTPTSSACGDVVQRGRPSDRGNFNTGRRMKSTTWEKVSGSVANAASFPTKNYQGSTTAVGGNVNTKISATSKVIVTPLGSTTRAGPACSSELTDHWWRPSLRH